MWPTPTRYRVRIARTREDLANPSAAGFTAHDVTESTYTITGLEPDSTYWVQVSAFNATGQFARLVRTAIGADAPTGTRRARGISASRQR